MFKDIDNNKNMIVVLHTEKISNRHRLFKQKTIQFFFSIEANMNIQLAIQCSNISTYVTFLLTFSCFISSFLILIPLMIRFLLTLRWFYYDYYCFLLIFFLLSTNHHQFFVVVVVKAV